MTFISILSWKNICIFVRQPRTKEYSSRSPSARPSLLLSPALFPRSSRPPFGSTSIGGSFVTSVSRSLTRFAALHEARPNKTTRNGARETAEKEEKFSLNFSFILHCCHYANFYGGLFSQFCVAVGPSPLRLHRLCVRWQSMRRSLAAER